MSRRAARPFLNGCNEAPLTIQAYVLWRACQYACIGYYPAMAKLTPEGCRAARAILKWSMRELAQHSAVAWTTVNQIESGKPFRASTGERIAEAFAAHGVELLNGDSPGARLRGQGG